MASQSEIDSSLCTLNAHISRTPETHSVQFPPTHHVFPLFQLLALSWLPCPNKGMELILVVLLLQRF